jgi:hypothetical protein
MEANNERSCTSVPHMPSQRGIYHLHTGYKNWVGFAVQLDALTRKHAAPKRNRIPCMLHSITQYRCLRTETLANFLYEPSCCVAVLTTISFSQNTTIYSIMYSSLHVPVTSNHHQTDISVHGHDMFSATVWDPYCLYLLCRISSIWMIKHNQSDKSI